MTLQIMVTCLLAGLTPCVFAAEAFHSIRPDNLLRHTQVLASDDFEGRAPGGAGEEKTVKYLIEQFRSMGLQPGGLRGAWTQPVPIVGVKSEVNLVVDGEPMVFPQDFVAWSPRTDPEVQVSQSELVFAGYGVAAPEYGWDDFKNVDVRGKTIVVLVGDPPVPDPSNPGELDPKMFKGRAMTYYGRWTYKFEEAARRGAAAAIIVHETKPAAYPWFVVINSWSRERFDLAADKDPTVQVASWISLERAEKMFARAGMSYSELKARALSRDFKPVELRLRADWKARQSVRRVDSQNVVAMLPGRSGSRRDEWIVYTAHWDHLGRDIKATGDQIFNGASDNAVGTAGLLELARSFAEGGKRPNRSLLFLAVTAEEQGLLGAKYYAANPIHPLRKTVANINMDRLNTFGPTRDVSIVGWGQNELEDVLARHIHAQGRRVVPDSAPEKGSYFRSDHFEFAKAGVPALYIKGGMDYRDRPSDFGRLKEEEYTDRDYHKVSDEVKPDWDLRGAAEDLQLLRLVGLELANGRSWPTWKKGSEFRRR